MTDDLVCVLFCLPGAPPVDGPELEITESMIGNNTWKCEADNGGGPVPLQITFTVSKCVPIRLHTHVIHQHTSYHHTVKLYANMLTSGICKGTTVTSPLCAHSSEQLLHIYACI